MYRKRQMSLMCGGQQIPYNAKVPRNAEVETGAPEQQITIYWQVNSSWANTAINDTKQRHLGTLAYKIKANRNIRWRKQASVLGGWGEGVRTRARSRLCVGSVGQK